VKESRRRQRCGQTASKGLCEGGDDAKKTIHRSKPQRCKKEPRKGVSSYQQRKDEDPGEKSKKLRNTSEKKNRIDDRDDPASLGPHHTDASEWEVLVWQGEKRGQACPQDQIKKRP